MQKSWKMGQALRRATGMVRKSPPAPPYPVPPQSRTRNVERMPSVPPGRVGPQIGAQDRLEIAPENSEGSRLGNDSNILEERDPNFDAMLSQMVGRISSKPGGKLEMGEAFIVDKYGRPLPRVRSSKADTGSEAKAQAPGTLKPAQLREILLLYSGKSEEQQGRMSAEDIAKKFRIETSQVQNILQYVSLPQEEANSKTTQEQE